MDTPAICPGCHEPADPAGKLPTVMVATDRWHLACQDPRTRHGLDQTTVPPISRGPKPPPAKPVSQDPEAMRRLRGR